MDGYGWNADAFESFDDDYAEDWYDTESGDAEFIGPALGLAAARTLGRKQPARRPVPTAAAKPYMPGGASARQPVVQTQLAGALKRVEDDMQKVNAGIKALESRLDSYSAQMVALQKRSDVEVSAENFRSSFTSAGLGLGLAIAGNKPALGLAHVIALGQSNFRAVGYSTRKHPFSTFAFPIGTLLIAGWGDKLWAALKRNAGTTRTGGPGIDD